MTNTEAQVNVQEYFFLRQWQLEMLDRCSERDEVLKAMGSNDVIKARDLLIRAEIIFW